MLQQFKSSIEGLLDTTGSQRYLLAFSGGIDSVCLAHLLVESKISFDLAHVNFGLRGEESDEDEQFARKWAKNHGLHIHLLHGKTEELAESKGISIQMAAREIRYEFFEKIRREENLQGIILAHQEDDQLETILLNLLRGTGIEGMYGMAERRGWLIRPFLGFSRKEIENYVQANHLEWREDSSNQKTDYKRNKLRHLAMPVLLDLEPDARKNLLVSFSRLKDTGRAFSGLFENWKSQHLQVEKSHQFLPYSAFQNQLGASSLIYFWLREFGFNSDQASQIFEASTTQTAGKIFKSPSHWINLDRTGIFLSENPKEFSTLFLGSNDNILTLPNHSYEITQESTELPLDRNLENAQMDLEALSFPLTIRTWQEGDRFIPLGMNSSKKISDYLIDSKIPLVQKENVKVLVSDDRIAWVIGFRIADWVKRTPATRTVLYFKKK